MPGKVRRRAERIGLSTIATLGLVVIAADALGWLDRLAADGTIPKITLLMLSTVTIFLLLEVERFQTLDNIEKRLAALDIQGMAEELKNGNYAGLVRVHKRFAEEVFCRYLGTARRVTILNTWIPNLDVLEKDIELAVDRRAEVRIMLLHPKSMVAGLRTDALRAGGVDRSDDQVTDGVKRCLGALESMHNRASKNRKACLKVRVYNSLPSVSVYRADEHYLVSVFLHGQLAIHTPQFEINGASTVLGRQIQTELDTLWNIGHDIDLTDWTRSVNAILN